MQRLAIASVLAMEPKVLVLDEPTSQLDPQGTREVFDAVAALCRQGMTVIMAEHKIELLAAHADRILVLQDGKLVADDSPRAVFSRSSVAIPRPPVTAAAAALAWTRPEGGLPITVEEAVQVGQERLGPRDAAPEDGAETDATQRNPSAATSEYPHGAPAETPSEPPGNPVIAVRDVHFHYVPGVPVLRGITLNLYPGATAIIGQNGAGKSTFVRLLNGLLKPVSGQVLVKGVDTRNTTVATLARTVGLVFQNPSDQLFKSRVLDEVMFGPLNLGLAPREAERRAREALAQVGLNGVEHRNPYDLGLAERKLVTIASVLSMGTEVIVLDEPTIGQDEEGVRRLGELVRALAAQGRTVVTITHDMNFVAQYFQRVLVFSEGRVLADGDAAAVFSQADVLRRAGVEAPQITRLSQALKLAPPALTVEQFVARVQSLQDKKRPTAP